MTADDRCTKCRASFRAGEEIFGGTSGWRHALSADCDIAGLLARFTTSQLQAEIARRGDAA